MAISYRLTNATAAHDAQLVIRSDGAFIPADPSNIDFAAYLAWAAEGNAPADPGLVITPVPSQVSRRQFFQAAAQEGLITTAEAVAIMATGAIPESLSAAIAALPAAEQFAAQMAVLGDQTFGRSSAIIVALATVMNETSADLDALFILAASL